MELDKILKEQWEEMMMKIPWFVKQKWFESIEDMINKWYKVMYKTEMEKTDDWYKYTIEPYIEKFN